MNLTDFIAKLYSSGLQRIISGKLIQIKNEFLNSEKHLKMPLKNYLRALNQEYFNVDLTICI